MGWKTGFWNHSCIFFILRILSYPSLMETNFFLLCYFPYYCTTGGVSVATNTDTLSLYHSIVLEMHYQTQFHFQLQPLFRMYNRGCCIFYCTIIHMYVCSKPLILSFIDYIVVNKNEKKMHNKIHLLRINI